MNQTRPETPSPDAKPREILKRGRPGDAVTLGHVAMLAGVHPMTVSNALKGTGRVAPETRAKIRRIAQELDYKPNLAARALVTGCTHTVAVLTGPVSEHFYAHVLHLLEAELFASDYKMLMLRSRDVQSDLLSAVRANTVDGVIAIDAFPELRGLVQAETAPLPPCVYAGVLSPEAVASLAVDHIKIDLVAAIEEAVTAMLERGARRVAYLAANAGMARDTEVRARTYRAHMEAADLPAEIINLEIGVDTSRREVTRSRLIQYLRDYGCPDGLLCQNDEMAIATYRALRDLGYRVPEDVQLVGCDGLQDMEYFDPPLSTVVQPVEAMCALAWQFLQRRLSDPALPLQHARLDAHLQVRPSLQAATASRALTP